MNWLLLTLVIGVIAVQWEVFRRLRRYAKRIENEARQNIIESRLYAILDIHQPLPPLRGWALSPDIAWEYVRLLFRTRPEVVVECGSGASTIVAGYTLKLLGRGTVIALEHEKTFAVATAQAIERHGLQDFARVIHAPLCTQLIGERHQQWYDLSHIDLPNQIDVLFVDGPPAHLQPLTRFPALPLLKTKLKPGACILLDDTKRDDEQKTISAWMVDVALEREELNAEKGATLLTVKPSSQPYTEHEKRP